jgi:hypothetical protein
VEAVPVAEQRATRHAHHIPAAAGG